MATSDPQACSEALQHGLEQCRKGHWKHGVSWLSRLVDVRGNDDLPGLFYSYLGYGIALCERRVREGLRLCEHAVRMEFYQPENYLNLARTRLLAGNRRGAYRALEEGLRLDPVHEDLGALARSMGHRRRPVIPFLSRANLLNRLLGHLRHAALS